MIIIIIIIMIIIIIIIMIIIIMIIIIIVIDLIATQWSANLVVEAPCEMSIDMYVDMHIVQ